MLLVNQSIYRLVLFRIYIFLAATTIIEIFGFIKHFASILSLIIFAARNAVDSSVFFFFSPLGFNVLYHIQMARKGVNEIYPEVCSRDVIFFSLFPYYCPSSYYIMGLGRKNIFYHSFPLIKIDLTETFEHTHLLGNFSEDLEWNFLLSVRTHLELHGI